MCQICFHVHCVLRALTFACDLNIEQHVNIIGVPKYFSGDIGCRAVDRLAKRVSSNYAHQFKHGFFLLHSDSYTYVHVYNQCMPILNIRVEY